MFKGLIATTLMIAAAVEPVVSETDLVKYGLTQGGLLAVVLVLLWSYRKDMVGKLSDVGDQLAVMTSIVSKSTEAQLKSAEAVERMARALEVLNVRREDRHERLQ